MKLYCATSNAGKLREFHLAAARLKGDWQLIPLTGIPPCEETGATFEENAVQKAVYYSRQGPGPLFAEDSGLEVEALGGEPGIRSARFAGEGASDEQNNRLLVQRLSGNPNRSARYVCAIALADAGKVGATFQGRVDGRILESPRGANGFGYDPYFLYEPLGLTFAELSADEKLAVSHRGKALAAMFQHLVCVTLGP